MTKTKKVTIYMDADIHKFLKLCAATQDRTISHIVNEMLKEQLAEDMEDINDCIARQNEQGIPIEDFLEQLKQQEKI